MLCYFGLRNYSFLDGEGKIYQLLHVKVENLTFFRASF